MRTKWFNAIVLMILLLGMWPIPTQAAPSESLPQTVFSANAEATGQPALRAPNAGHLEPAPESFEVTLEAGGNAKRWLTLENTGSAAASFMLLETPGGYLPLSPTATRWPALSAADLPWLSAAPLSGTVAAGAKQSVLLTFDASTPEASQPGTYYGAIQVNTDTPYPTATLPVTMHVTPPATWGQLSGNIAGLGHCDAHPTPLEGANVIIESGAGLEWSLATNAEGEYQLWLDAALSPFTVTVTAEEHLPQVFAAVNVIGAAVTTLDVDLRWEQPCIIADPDPIQVAVGLGQMLTIPFTVTNAGAAATTFTLSEANGGANLRATSGQELSAEIPWLTAVPTSGLVAADTAFSLDLTFAATEAVTVTLPGAYFGTLFIHSDDPLSDQLAVPVTMTVLPPANWGKLNGVVYSLGYCESLTTTLAGVEVLIEAAGGQQWTALTDADGYYQVWLEAEHSPVTLTVAVPEHAPLEIADLEVFPGADIITDFYLRPLAPCVQAQPPALHVTLELGATASENLTLTNTGVLATAWRLEEENLGLEQTGTAPGYHHYFYEGFEATVFPPVGWTRIRNSGNCDWLSSRTSGYWNQTGGSGYFADANSDYCGAGTTMNVELRTPSIDLSGIHEPLLIFQTRFRKLGSSRGYVDISTDGGSNWTNLLTYMDNMTSGRREVIELSTYAGEPNIILRFHYVAPSWDFFWQVDDVYIAAVDPVIWLDETPTSGYLAADTGEQVVAMDFDASVVNQPGDYVAHLWLHSADLHAPARLPVTLTVTPPTDWGQVTGTVNSQGHCDAEMLPLADATITLSNTDGVIATLNTDADGAYSYWLPTGAYSVTVTATKHPTTTVAVNILPGSAHTQDFALRWLGPCLSHAPEGVAVALQMGQTATATLTLTNAGGGAATFQLRETAGDYLPGALLITAPESVVADGGFEAGPLAGIWDEYSRNFETPICDLATCDPGGGSGPRTGAYWARFGGSLEYESSYVEQYFHIPTGMTYLSFWLETPLCDSPDDYLEVWLDEDRLFRQDGGSPWCGHSGYRQITLDISGYADDSSYALLFSAESFARQGGLTIFSVDDVVIHSGLPWLTANPAAGSLPAEASTTVELLFDAGVSAVTAPGVYSGELLITSNNPTPAPSVPVTLTVTLPETHGQLAGAVTGLGHCDDPVTAAPLTGATVTVTSAAQTWTLFTDAAGDYALWLDAAHSPVTLTVAAPGYAPHSVAAISVIPAATTTQDVALRPLASCVAAQPPAFHVTLELGATASEALTLNNTGALETAWQLEDTLLLDENFEEIVFPPSGWLSYDLDGRGTQWVRSTARAYTGSASASHLYATTQPWQDGWLVSPPMTIAPYAVAELSFSESSFAPADYYKHSLWVCTDNCASPPTNWESVQEFPLPTNAWRRQTVNLDAYAGQTFRLAFRYQGWDADDWYIDAVQVQQGLPVWLEVTPQNGDLDPDTGAQIIDLNFDAAMIAQPGEYTTHLRIASADPWSLMLVPVTMTVTPPGDWGQVTGVVASLGHCDAEANPLANATITLSNADSVIATLNTEADGAYSYWLPTGAYTVAVTAGEHLPAAASVNVLPGGAHTQDFALRWLGPCLSRAPEAVAVSLPLGQTTTEVLTLTNTGGGAATFQLLELPGSYMQSTTLTAAQTDVVADGGFEAGPLAGIWEIYSTNFETLICDVATCGGSGPRTGAYWARLGGSTEYEESYVEQYLHIPTGMDYLTFWLELPTCDSPDDYLEVWLDGDPVFVVNGGSPWCDHSGYQQITVNISDYADDYECYLSFYAESFARNGGMTIFSVDDVAIHSGLPWLAETPAAGSIPAEAFTTVALHFDAGVPAVTVPGVYYGELHIASNNPSPVPPVPVTLTVTLPETYGQIAGAVTGLGPCDDPLTAAPLAGAAVTVTSATQTWTLFTDEAGGYALWLDAAHSPVTLTVAAPGHAPRVIAALPVIPGATTTQDMALRPLAPCAAVTPLRIEETLTLGLSASLPLTIENSGAHPLTWTLSTNAGIAWLATDPVAGELAPDSAAAVTVTLDAADFAQPGVYTAALFADNNSVNTPLVVPVTLTVAAPETWGQLHGLVSSRGYCDIHPAPLADAVVFIESSLGLSWTLTTDSAGVYDLWLDEAHSPLTVSISNEAGYEAQVFTNVHILSGTITPLNASLRWYQPCVAWGAADAHVTLELGLTQTLAVSITNQGAYTAYLTLAEQDTGFSPAPLHPWRHLNGPATFNYTLADSTETDGPAFNFVDISAYGAPLGLGDDEATAVDIGFPFNYYGEDYTEVYVSSNGLLSFGTVVTNFINAPAMPLPALPNNLVAVMWDDLRPGAQGEIYAHSFALCPYGKGACLVVQYDNLSHANGEAAGVWEVILFSSGSILMQYADAGQLAGASSTTGIENALGTQGLLYAANTPAALQDGLAVCFAYPGHAADCVEPYIPWLTLTPIQAELAADGGEGEFTFTFDTRVAEVTQPGDYTGYVWLESNDPVQPRQALPVTLTVEIPAAWGWLSGTVLGWNHCDVAAFGLENASVVIQGRAGTLWTTTTNAGGGYGLWLDEADGPFTLTVTAVGYLSATRAAVEIVGGEVTVVNFQLRTNTGCIGVDQHALDVTLTRGHTLTHELLLRNMGAGTLHISAVQGETWLAADMTGGALAPDSEQPLTLTLSAVAMPLGAHHGALVLFSNDPGVPELHIPVTMTVIAPDVQVRITAAPPERVAPDDLITYTITLTNASAYHLPLTLTNPLTDVVAYVTDSATNGLVYFEAGNDRQMTWSGALAPAEMREFTYQVHVSAEFLSGVIVSAATIEFSDGLSRTDAVSTTVSTVPTTYYIYLPLVMRQAP